MSCLFQCLLLSNMLGKCTSPGVSNCFKVTEWFCLEVMTLTLVEILKCLSWKSDLHCHSFTKLIWQRRRVGRRHRERERETEKIPFVPLTYTFISCFLYVTWPEMEPTTSVYLMTFSLTALPARTSDAYDLFLFLFQLLFKYSCLHFSAATFPCPTHPHLPPSILPVFGFVLIFKSFTFLMLTDLQS